MDGRTAQMANQDETIAATAAAAMSSACAGVIACMLAHTLRYDAKCGMANQNVATTRTAAITARAILRPGRLPLTGPAWVPESSEKQETPSPAASCHCGGPFGRPIWTG